MLLVDLNHHTERATPATVLGRFRSAGSHFDSILQRHP